MFSRHDLVWLTPAGWDTAPALTEWRKQDWPAIVRRRDAGVGADAVCLGIPLPERQRVALVVDARHIARSAPPLTLADAIAAAPPQWLAGLVALQRAAEALDVRVYGSLAMASITGLPYLRAGSDIDLLARPTTRSEFAAAVALLEEHAQVLPLDGEIVFPSGDAVAWKEWIAARRDHARVLVKSLHTVRLADPAQLFSSLPA
ncbi:malonate decarboxylase holo-[acyl-carrier-protein] synthase [Massilia sp. S19_KUP03_FR1]|uniref:malonate decarboxylase holo-[acyl-carrier-protein] synthase n=1 Tax=Massilia sp. S19_KUP03_FR1 TaxID=3025503 RepID=UPI002FCD6E4C